MTSGGCRQLKILPCRMCSAISRSQILAFSHHGNNNTMLPFKSELTAFFPFLFPFPLFFPHSVSSTFSYSHPHSSLFFFPFFFVWWWGEYLDRDRGREGEKQGESVSESDAKRGREKGRRATDRRRAGGGGVGVKMRESFLSCLSDPASQPVIQSISQTEAVFFPAPLDVLYLAGVLLQLGVKPGFGDRTDTNLTNLKSKFDCAPTLHK